MIHKGTLASKEMSPDRNIVLATVENYKEMRSLKSRIFLVLCKDISAVHSALLFGVDELRNKIAFPF